MLHHSTKLCAEYRKRLHACPKLLPSVMDRRLVDKPITVLALHIIFQAAFVRNGLRVSFTFIHSATSH